MPAAYDLKSRLSIHYLLRHYLVPEQFHCLGLGLGLGTYFLGFSLTNLATNGIVHIVVASISCL